MKRLTFICLLLPMCLCDPCTFSENRIHCTGVSQQEFLFEFYKNQPSIQKGNAYSVEIVDSNCSTLEVFVDPPIQDDEITITTLAIRRSAVENVYEEAFARLAGLTTLDLSWNKIEDIAFAQHLPETLAHLDLSNNRILTVDFNVLRSGIFFNFSNNNIATILPSEETKYFENVDLSHNRIKEFDESYLNCLFDSVDLRTNHVTRVRFGRESGNIMIQRESKKNVILSGNNITSISSTRYTTITISNLDLSSSVYNVTDFVFSPNIVWNKLTFSNGVIPKLNSRNLIRSSNDNPPLIDFSNCSISHVEEFYFRQYYVSLLNLSFNEIGILHLRVFDEAQIAILDLSYSKIEHIASDTFYDLQCGSLILRGNKLTTIENMFPSNYIIEIDLSDNPIEAVTDKFCPLCSSLRALNLSNTLISKIKAGAFATLRSLEILDLSNCKISRLESRTFDNLPNLTTINLVRNEIQMLPEYAFSDLLNLRTIDIRGNAIATFEGKAFFNLSLDTLKLDCNKLERIETKAFNYVRNLKELNFSGCQISQLESESFSHLPSIETIDLSSNKFTKVPKHLFSTMDNILYIFLDGNNITSLSLPFDNSVMILSVTITFNGIYDVNFRSNVYLRKLFIKNSEVKSMEKNCFMGLFNLNELHFNDSNIYEIQTGALNGLFNLNYLDSQTLFKHTRTLKSNMFNHLRVLPRLNLGHLHLEQIERETFIGLESLEELLLYDNDLSLLQPNTFSGLNNLKHLDLYNNQLSSFDAASFNGLELLMSLDLRQNQLKNIDQKCFDHLHHVELLTDPLEPEVNSYGDSGDYQDGVNDYELIEE